MFGTSLIGIFAATGFFFLLLGIAVILSIIGLWIIFTKAGVEGWKSIIPIYNIWVLVEIFGLN